MSDWNTPLTLTAVTAGSTVQLTKVGDPTVGGLQYRTDSSAAWSNYTIDDVITLENVGDYVQFQNTSNSLSSSASAYVRFVMTGSIAASGNLQAMLNYRTDCAKQCFRSLFQDCAALTSAPELPSTSLNDYCYYALFTDCTGLTEMPELPATTIGYVSYGDMFKGCTGLTVAKDIPATTVRGIGCLTMFMNCTNLITPPKLPAAILADQCYRGMFIGCTSLTYAPELPATTLESRCYERMFDGCSSLSEVKVSFTEWVSGATTDWLKGVSSSGNFYKPVSLPETRGASNIPTGWAIKSEYKPLTLTAVTAGSTVQLTKTGSPTVSGLQYRTSTEDSWSSYTIATVITLTDVGDYVQFQNTSGNLSSSNSSYVTFAMTGGIAASGNTQALLNYKESCNANCFRSLFQGCTALTTAPDLPATTLATYCYFSLFQGCSGLVKAPALPATTIAYVSYGGMFKDCTSLTLAPELPATTLNGICYLSMFANCTSLEVPPALPATTLISECYRGMFSGCTSLRYSPELPATTLASRCYEKMFEDCAALSEVKVSFTEWLNGATLDWLKNTAPAGTFYKPNALSDVRGVNNIPTNWTLKSEYKPLTFTAVTAGSTVQLTKTGSPTVSGLQYRTSTKDAWSSYTIDDVITLTNVGDYVQFRNTESTLSSSDSSYVQFVMTGKLTASGDIQALLDFSKTCYQMCFFSVMRNCTSLITPPEFSATTLGDYCYYRALRGCSSIVFSPVIPAKILASGSCYEMCRDCSNITSAGEIKSETLGDYSLAYMFYNCSNLTEIKVNMVSWSGTNITEKWVSGVAPKGTFYKRLSLPEEYGLGRIPTGWDVINVDEIECSPGLPTLMDPLGVTVKEEVPLTLTATQDNSTVKLTATGSPTTAGLHYRLGTSGKWLPYTIDSTINLNSGDSVQFWNSAEELSKDGSNYCTFVIAGRLEASGNVQSLLNFSDTVQRYGFYSLFDGCDSLLQSPDLPATKLNTDSYAYMFRGCSLLARSPELPALNLSSASGVYYAMFSGCTSLLTTPSLPSRQLGTYCYYAMFRDCASLKSMPGLSSVSPPAFGYTGMFRGCSQLSVANIPFSIAGSNSCCNNMFYDCASLSLIDVALTSWSSYSSSWVYGVSSGGTFIKPSTLPEEYGVNRIPTGWTVINKD